MHIILSSVRSWLHVLLSAWYEEYVFTILLSGLYCCRHDIILPETRGCVYVILSRCMKIIFSVETDTFYACFTYSCNWEVEFLYCSAVTEELISCCTLSSWNSCYTSARTEKYVSFTFIMLYAIVSQWLEYNCFANCVENKHSRVNTFLAINNI